MKARVIWTEPALDELALIYQYLLDNTNITTAKRVIEDILNTGQLEAFPKSGAVEPNLKRSGKEYRYILRGHNKYKVIYRITDTVIYITDIFDCRKDPSSIKI
ncbi:MAG TPA: type II toxin-antitoxin system RelE/ParE family toxin [Dysgonomonas sp.]|uniref:type II toxin-antitoxin system RelE/ParE family toxin n=1 Tax=unclassified Dysgonomonas TaxID=2630389 RepID=UPI002CC616CF|nr:type II toxin-antitoxin system RelE/ParE family toxin [Dysgonomonas sp.]HML65237.1 type II toxin-antitoxin system RelE/ParE family toxin [Dysgonomonas sp.]